MGKVITVLNNGLWDDTVYTHTEDSGVKID
jgi:hypothetical protein